MEKGKQNAIVFLKDALYIAKCPVTVLRSHLGKKKKKKEKKKGLHAPKHSSPEMIRVLIADT